MNDVPKTAKVVLIIHGAGSPIGDPGVAAKAWLSSLICGTKAEQKERARWRLGNRLAARPSRWSLVQPV